jgi:protein N-lysine methyltransferase METTL21D
MADVTYNVDVFPALLRTLRALLALAVSQNPLGGMNRAPPFVLLAYKERDPAERSLFDHARQLGVLFEQVASMPGAGGVPIEIYLALYLNSDGAIPKQSVWGMEGVI